MMNRKIRTKIAATAMVVGVLSATGLGQGVTVEVNGQPVHFQGARPQMIGGRVMVPLRGVLEQLGAYVDWDAGSRTVTARKGSMDILMRVGDRSAAVNGRTTYLDAPARILQGSTMVPLRFMSEALGADVEWIAQTGTVRINTTAVVEPFPPRPNPPYNPPTTGRASITSFRVDAPNATLRSGDMVRLELRGTPAADVHFSIPNVTGTKRMREESPGLYVAEWTVPAEANGMRESAIVAKLIFNGDEETIRPMDAPGDVPPVRDNTPPTITGMEPRNGERLVRPRPMIRVRVSDAGGVDADSWRLLIDGDDVSRDATYSNGMISYQPSNRLAQGIHTVEVSIQDMRGNRSSSSWQFEVGRDTDPRPGNYSFTHDARTTVREGDLVTFTLRAEPDARVTYSIGNVIVDRAMSETSRGVYTSTYRVRRGDNLLNLPVVARVRLDDGSTYTVEADPIRYGENLSTPSTPVITSPTGSRVGNSMILRAASTGARTYEVRVDYVTTVLGGLRLNGTVHQRTYQADSRGELRTGEIALDTPAGGSNTEYTITITAIGANGVRSEPATMVVRR